MLMQRSMKLAGTLKSIVKWLNDNATVIEQEVKVPEDLRKVIEGKDKKIKRLPLLVYTTDYKNVHIFAFPVTVSSKRGNIIADYSIGSKRISLILKTDKFSKILLSLIISNTPKKLVESIMNVNELRNEPKTITIYTLREKALVGFTFSKTKLVNIGIYLPTSDGLLCLYDESLPGFGRGVLSKTLNSEEDFYQRTPLLEEVFRDLKEDIWKNKLFLGTYFRLMRKLAGYLTTYK